MKQAVTEHVQHAFILLILYIHVNQILSNRYNHCKCSKILMQRRVAHC